MNINLNRDLKKLGASDFPGIDETTFNEWKALKLRTNRAQQIVSLIAIGIWFISTLQIAGYYPSICFVIFMIPGYVFFRVKNKRLRQLEKGLKISDRLWAKKKGRVFTE